MNRKLVCIKFKKQLLDLYNKSSDLVNTFYAYLGFLIEHTKNKRYVQFTKWQIEDMLMSIYNPKIDTSRVALETAWNYSRRGGKSRGLTIVAVFFSLLDKLVIWRSPHTDQLGQCTEWFNMNPFVAAEHVSTQNTVEVYNSPDINISVLSAGRVASREADVLIYDEMGWCFKDLKLYEFYKASRPMIAASDFKHIIHASTPALYTVFHDEWEFLKGWEAELETKLTSYHPWHDCPWITPEWVESERISHSDCSWYIDQNYEALFVIYGGNVFDRNKIILVGDPRYPEYPKNYWRYSYKICVGGVDFNGENTQHYLVIVYFDDKYVHILEEIKFLDLWLLDKYITKGLSLELEEGMFNTQFTDQTRRMGLSCIYQEWNEDIKQNRVREVQERIIIIDKDKCPVTYKNILEAGYDEKSRLPKLAKRTDQHGLDALLHCMHENSGKIHFRDRSKQKNLFGKIEIYNPITHV